MEQNILLNKNKINLNYVSDNNLPSSCGYCKKLKTSFKKGSFVCESIIPIDYEVLMYNGWRKCGNYYYKPDLEKSCCQLHTIRLDVNEFKINKSQEKIIKKLNKYLNVEENVKNAEINVKCVDCNNNSLYLSELTTIKKFIYEFLSFINLKEISLKLFPDLTNTSTDIKLAFNKNKNCYSSSILNNVYYKVIKSNGNKAIDEIGSFIIDNNIKNCLLNANKTNNKNEYNQLLTNKFDDFVKFISNKNINFSLNENNNDNSNINAFELINNYNFKIENLFINMYKINNLNIEKNKKLNITSINNKENINNSNKTFKIILDYADEKSIYYENKYLLFKKYQSIVHKDKLSELSKSRFNSSWNNFLFTKDKKFSINITNEAKENLSNILKKIDLKLSYYFKSLFELDIIIQYGTYNLNYILNDDLIAVSVIDILPNSVSSVYCYYNTDYNKLSLGYLTALSEIEFIKILNKCILKSDINENKFIKYYFMGFYIQSCQKMVYKGDYNPSQLLCPITNEYVYLNSEIKNLINNYKGKQLFSEDNNKNINCKNEHNNLIINKKEIETIYNISKLLYNNNVYKLNTFIINYISKEYQDRLIKCVLKLIEECGKKVAVNLEYII